MLELRNINKSYKLTGQWIPALKGILNSDFDPL